MDALAGINIVIPITCVTFGVAVMLATGAGAIIGEHLGRNEMEHRIFSFMCVVLPAAGCGKFSDGADLHRAYSMVQ